MIDNFLIGAQKAGSTTLYSWLSQHPEINAPESIKDFHFFTSEEYFPKGYSWLESLYGQKDKRVKLHGAVNYIFREDAAQRIAEYNPEAKLILVLRDPVKRAYSAYQYFKKLDREQLSFEDAIEREKQGRLNTQVEKDDFAYLEHGYYAKQLENWLGHFKKDQLLVLVYEELFANPQQHLQNIYRFLDLKDTLFIPELKAKNISGEVKYGKLNRLIYSDKSPLRKLLNATRAKQLIPLHIRGEIQGTFREWNTKPGSKSGKIPENTYRELIDLYREDMSRLGDMINKDLTKIWQY